MYAPSRYVGEERVDGALRSLLQKKAGSLATTLDLHGELQAVTPDSLLSLLHDLFAVNTFWTFDTEQATLPTEAPHPLGQADDHGSGAGQTRAWRH